MNITWGILTEPVLEPITILEARQHIGLVSDDDDTLVDSYRVAARQAAEEYLSRGLLTQTWQLTADYFYEELSLPMAAPLQSVTSVKYYDTTGTLQTLASTVYDVDTTSRPGRICRAANQTWPTLQSDRTVGRVIVTYVVGWLTAAAVPERIKQGLRLYLAACHHDREGLDMAAGIRAAEHCWTDRVFWKEPRLCVGASHRLGLY